MKNQKLKSPKIAKKLDQDRFSSLISSKAESLSLHRWTCITFDSIYGIWVFFCRKIYVWTSIKKNDLPNVFWCLISMRLVRNVWYRFFSTDRNICNCLTPFLKILFVRVFISMSWSTNSIPIAKKWSSINWNRKICK